eukprot:5123187-Pleurochrysis_carterae.AAC.1
MSAPVLDASLVVKRLGILYMYDLPDGTEELLWCLCEVLLVKEKGARVTVISNDRRKAICCVSLRCNYE